MEELISIVVPVYKTEQYLSRCVDSILRQTYRQLEIILVDDGSPDSCPDICDDYARKDKRIKVIHKVNGGLSDARNAGIEVATGMYLGFVDSDDYIHPEMYERLWKALKKHEADIVICDLELVYHKEYKTVKVDSAEVEIYDRQQAVKMLLNKYLHVMGVVTWNKLYKKELFEDIRFPKDKIHEDEFTTYKLFWKSRKVVKMDNKLYYYLQRNDSIMGGHKEKFSYDSLEAYEQMAEFFEQEKNTELLYAIKYKYLYMLKEAIKKLKVNGETKQYELLSELEETYREEYKKCIPRIKGVKRKVRLGLYYWFKINV